MQGLNLKAQKKMRIEMLSAEVITANNCLTLLTNLSIETNSVDQDQTAPIVNSLIWLHTSCNKASKTLQQTTKADDFC